MVGCAYCGREAKMGLVFHDELWAEQCYCTECWEFARLVYELRELAKAVGLKELDYPDFWDALSTLQTEWTKARAVTADALIRELEMEARAEQLKKDPGWQAFKRLVDDHIASQE